VAKPFALLLAIASALLLVALVAAVGNAAVGDAADIAVTNQNDSGPKMLGALEAVAGGLGGAGLGRLTTVG
jgi:hypothetical protein